MERLGLIRTSMAFASVLGLGVFVTHAGCATPCVDDGLGQEYCPEDDSGAEAGDTGTTSETGSGNDESGTGGGGTCDLFRLDLTPQTPTIVLLVDQSESMTAAFDMTDRWAAIQTTLLDPQDGVVTNLQSEVRFGLSLYTSNDGDMGGACPILTETPPALNNFDDIDTVFQNSGGPQGDTPTGESLAVVADALSMDQAPGEKYVVVATDGEPDTCAEPDPQNGQGLAVMAAQDAYAKGVKTFIISVGDDVSNDHLQDMANAGAGVQMGDPDATFYKALDQQALLDAFNEIVQGTRDCRIDLDMAIIPDKANLCAVNVNGMDLLLDDPDGWQVNTSTEIELVGQACTDIQEGDVTIEMDCDCTALE
jgi:hypothetical protein